MSRIAILIAGAAVLVALAAPPASPGYTNPGLVYLCSPPLPVAQQNCAGWHNAPVTVVWVWNQGAASGSCPDTTLTADSDGSSVLTSCTVTDRGDATPTTVGVKLKIDRTPPTILSATPTRAADSNGWWNHPVGFTFVGTDPLSGIAGCDTVTFAGPGGPGAQVVGGCHDVAGNYGTAAFPVKYDNTPPTLQRVRAVAGNRSATLTWTESPDAVVTQVMRSPGRGGARSSVVYSGAGRRFHDRNLVNGTTYSYTVTAFDQAANPVSKTVATRPRVSLGLLPRRATRLTRAPLLRWPAVRGASYYNVQLFRGSVKELTAWPSHARMRLRRGWTFLGRHYRLSPGRYRWYVWPGYGSRAEHRFGRFIGQSSFVIVRRALR